MEGFKKSDALELGNCTVIMSESVLQDIHTALQEYILSDQVMAKCPELKLRGTGRNKLRTLMTSIIA